jgi:DNA-binding MarR family transcriptional regulator
VRCRACVKWYMVNVITMKAGSYPPKLGASAVDASGRHYDAALRHLVAGGGADHPDPLAAEALLTLLATARRIGEQFEANMARRGLSMARFAVLLRLWRTADHSAPMHELAEWCNVSPRNITGLVDGLQTAGLVVRTSDPADRRVTVVRLSADGAALIDEAAHAHFATQAKLGQSLDDTDRRQLIDLCVRLARGAGDTQPDDETG